MEGIEKKTWTPEGTAEYRLFKLISAENKSLTDILRQRVKLEENDLVLDVGGREGDISLALQEPEYVDIVDPDPTIKPILTPRNWWNDPIQEVKLTDHYSLIICSHVLGYLARQGDIQLKIIQRLLDHLKNGGVLVLFYNTNTGFMKELLELSLEHLDEVHYDHIKHSVLVELEKNSNIKLEHVDLSFSLNYPSFKELARCSWFLFGTSLQDISGTAQIYENFIRKKLENPSFEINERVTLVTKI